MLKYVLIYMNLSKPYGRDESVGTVTGYGLDGPRNESLCGGGDFPHLSRPALEPTQPPVQWVPGLSRGLMSGRGVSLTPHPLLVPWSRKSRAIPLLPVLAVRPVQSLSACTVQLYLYSPYGPYVLYTASESVQYSYTSTPPMGCTACTEPQCLYNTAIPLLPVWAVRPVQSLSACTVQLYLYSPYGPYGLYRASVPVQ